MKIALATNNPNKKREILELLSSHPITILTPKELGIDFDVEETGTTFEENARLKSAHLYSLTELPSIADDSGLCVRALGYAPGVYSARYGTAGMNDRDRAFHLLSEMSDKPDRYSYYYCSICLTDADGDRFFDGKCEGEISTTYNEGGQGFGYDPIFIYPPFRKHFSEVSPELKNSVSHRGIATRKLVEYLLRRLKK
jgi:XTP/dITP diphosphohydrolase